MRTEAEQNTAVKIRSGLSGVQETALITLYAKACESRLSDSLLRDHFSVAALEQLDLDFTGLKVPRDGMIGLAIRSHVLDVWTRQFLAKFPEAIVLQLGCGFDSRFFRVAPPPTAQWFGVDFPEVIAMRRRLYPDQPESSMIAASLTDAAWINEIPGGRPVFIVAEGVLPYLSADDVQQLFTRLVSHFPEGELAFDCYRPVCLKLLNSHSSLKATGARLQWGLGDPHEIEAWTPRLHLIEQKIDQDPIQLARLSWWCQLALKLPFVKRMGSLVRYSFGRGVDG